MERFGVLKEQIGHIRSAEFYANVEDREVILDRLEKHGEIGDFEIEIRTPYQSPARVAGCVSPIRYHGEHALVTALLDVTARREKERRLRVDQRLEALRRVAGGLVHQLNNGLVPIMTFSELVLNQLPSDSDAAGASTGSYCRCPADEQSDPEGPSLQ